MQRLSAPCLPDIAPHAGCSKSEKHNKISTPKIFYGIILISSTRIERLFLNSSVNIWGTYWIVFQLDLIRISACSCWRLNSSLSNLFDILNNISSWVHICKNYAVIDVIFRLKYEATSFYLSNIAPGVFPLKSTRFPEIRRLVSTSYNIDSTTCQLSISFSSRPSIYFIYWGHGDLSWNKQVQCVTTCLSAFFSRCKAFFAGNQLVLIIYNVKMGIWKY